jgi:hypothetical protein
VIVKQDTSYLRDIIHVVEHIQNTHPSDIDERFQTECNITKRDFRTLQGDFQGQIAAVDGSNAMVLEAGSYSVAAFRAAVSCYQTGRRLFLSRSSIRLARIENEPSIVDYNSLYKECFSMEPENGLSGEDVTRAASVIRDTLEYATALQTLERVGAGDVILLDGSLRVGHASHLPVLREILKKAGGKDILVAAVSKRTAATWGGGYPLILSVDRFAENAGIIPPWYIRIPEQILDGAAHKQWQRGRVYVAKLHRKSPLAFKIELPDYANEDAIERTFQACVAYADDGRIPGYPYPLMDAHRNVCIGEDVLERITFDVIRGMDRLGMDWKDYQQFFGDYHDEFKRY